MPLWRIALKFVVQVTLLEISYWRYGPQMQIKNTFKENAWERVCIRLD